MEKTCEKQIKQEDMPANLPDTFQLTDKMNFRKYDFRCSRIFHVPPIFRTKHFHQRCKKDARITNMRLLSVKE